MRSSRNVKVLSVTLKPYHKYKILISSQKCLQTECEGVGIDDYEDVARIWEPLEIVTSLQQVPIRLDHNESACIVVNSD